MAFKLGVVLLVMLNAGCGGKSVGQDADHGTEAGGTAAGGTAGTHRGNAAGQHAGGALTTPTSPDPPIQVGGGFSIGGQAGVGGNPNTPDGCNLTWWGGTLSDVVGLTSCAAPDDPATLAYGQTQLNGCEVVTGPLEQRQSDGVVSCRYRMDETRCGSDYQADYWLDLPVFGDGSKVVTLPDSVSVAGCANPIGMESTGETATLLAEQLLGVWVSCEGGSSTQLGEAVVFKADGSYEALSIFALGRLESAGGCDRRGLWGFIPGTNQLNLYVNSGTSIGHVRFYDGSPQRMIFSSGGQGTYVRAN